MLSLTREYKQSRYVIQRFKKTYLIFLCILLIFTTVAFAEDVKDKKGRIIKFDKPFHRIISLYGAHTENLYYLGLDSEIIGVSIKDNYPKRVSEKQRFSYHDGPEKFIASKPDLILIRPMIDNGYTNLIERLEKSGITIASFQPANVDEMYTYWLNLGKLTNKKVAAEKMVSEFKQKINIVKSITSDIPTKKRVYFESIHSKMKTFTQKAMPMFALETAGGVNAAEDAISSRKTNIANYGKEQILSKAGKIDVFIAQKGVMNAVNIEMIRNEPGFQIIKAIKNNQIYIIDENIVSRPVPRLYEGIIAIGSFLYPDIFNQVPIKKD